MVMIRRHLDHIVESNLAAVSKVRTKTHNKVQNISVAMLKNVGAEGTVLEPRAWDMGKHEKHHRPDINTTLPCGKKVLDIKLVWARCTKQHLAAEASKKETEAVEPVDSLLLLLLSVPIDRYERMTRSARPSCEHKKQSTKIHSATHYTLHSSSSNACTCRLLRWHFLRALIIAATGSGSAASLLGPLEVA